MRKKKFTIFALLLCALLTSSLLVLPASAEESAKASDTVDIPDTGTDNCEDIGENIENGKENAFSVAFGFFEENASEIFSVLSFIGSLLIMVTYKSGLLPFVEKGIGALAGGVKRIGERAESLGNEAGAFNSEIKAKLKEAETLLENMQTALSGLYERLPSASEDAASRERLETVMRAEIDMLYEIFMAASLPQYLKERVGERIGTMKHALGEGIDKNEGES